jgi:hypothetical protein
MDRKQQLIWRENGIKNVKYLGGVKLSSQKENLSYRGIDRQSNIIRRIGYLLCRFKINLKNYFQTPKILYYHKY